MGNVFCAFLVERPRPYISHHAHLGTQNHVIIRYGPLTRQIPATKLWRFGCHASGVVAEAGPPARCPQ